MKMNKVISIFLLLAVFSVNGEEDTTGLDSFGLFNKCEPLSFTIQKSVSDADDLYLDDSAIQSAIESRLRSARIYSDENKGFSSLRVTINVVNYAVSMNVIFNKIVHDPLFSDEVGNAITWMDGGTGLHGGREEFVMNNLSEFMDNFLVEYLRVNEQACGN